jgi:hypothetical protein
MHRSRMAMQADLLMEQENFGGTFEIGLILSSRFVLLSASRMWAAQLQMTLELTCF